MWERQTDVFVAIVLRCFRGNLLKYLYGMYARLFRKTLE